MKKPFHMWFLYINHVKCKDVLILSMWFPFCICGFSDTSCENVNFTCFLFHWVSLGRLRGNKYSNRSPSFHLLLSLSLSLSLSQSHTHTHKPVAARCSWLTDSPAEGSDKRDAQVAAAACSLGLCQSLCQYWWDAPWCEHLFRGKKSEVSRLIVLL